MQNAPKCILNLLALSMSCGKIELKSCPKKKKETFIMKWTTKESKTNK